MNDQRIALPQGAPDVLILKAIALGPRHGWAISERINQISVAFCTSNKDRSTPLSTVWNVEVGSRLDGRRRITTGERNTKAGRRQLETEADAWRKLAAAVALVLETVEGQSC